MGSFSTSVPDGELYAGRRYATVYRLHNLSEAQPIGSATNSAKSGAHCTQLDIVRCPAAEDDGFPALATILAVWHRRNTRAPFTRRPGGGGKPELASELALHFEEGRDDAHRWVTRPDVSSAPVRDEPEEPPDTTAEKSVLFRILIIRAARDGSSPEADGRRI